MQRKALVIGAIAPLLLATVALAQLRLAHAEKLCPWKGGGFGMFSTIDRPETRVVLAYLRSGADRVPVSFDSVKDWSRLVGQARILPSQENVVRLAGLVERRRWQRPARGARAVVIPDGQQPDPSAVVPVAGVDVEVWRLVHDGQAGTIGRELLTTVTQGGRP